MKQKHAKYSASGSYIWLNCAGATVAQSGLPDEEFAAAVQGSAAHALLEASLKNKIHPLRLRVSKYISEKKYQKLVNDDMRDHLTPLYEETMIKAQTMELHIEKKFDLKWIHPEMGGTGDILLIQPWGDLFLTDLKYGHKKVSASNNSQLAYYGLGAAQMVDWDFGKLHTKIYQPRVTRDSLVVSFTPSELRPWVDKFQKGIEMAEKPNAKRTAGDWCTFCKARKTCPAVRKEAESKAMVVFGEEAEEPSLRATPKDLSVQNIADILDKAAMIKGWLNDVATHAWQLAEKGTKIPGYKLAPTKSKRVWSDIKKAEKFFTNKLKSKAYAPKELLSPAQMEKLFKDKKAKALVGKYVAKISSGTKLVSEADGVAEIASRQSIFDDGAYD